MSVDIVSNTLPDRNRERIESEVRAALGEASPLEPWEVTLLGSTTLPRYVVYIRRAGGGFQRSWVFHAVDDAIKGKIESGIREAGFPADELPAPRPPS